jgi:hypothetical protein
MTNPILHQSLVDAKPHALPRVQDNCKEIERATITILPIIQCRRHSAEKSNCAVFDRKPFEICFHWSGT